MNLSKEFYEGRKLENLVENQTSYTLNNASLHIFETHKQAERVLLKFDKPVLASMLKGKKIMHLRDQQSFNFLPGESLILPSDEMMCIDFPEAQFNNPTQCLAMAISEDKISKVLDHMNELMPKVDEGEWSLMDYDFHFTNDIGIYQILQRLLFLFTEDHPSKDLFVDNMLEELIIRILQTNSRKIYTEKSSRLSSGNRLAYIVEYIRKNLHNPLAVKNLSKKACMSESNFYRVFKNELGISPIDFINNERIKLAVSLLQNPNKSIKEVYQECGFESRSYFNRVFKSRKRVAPGDYQSKLNVRA
ncbi:AraC family transcriptional regulator [Christiangramia echinicola]|uniref:Helix-turn-helix domain-containing protein n=1 Tax=Christiangramia echinicola TaxID=279359 RepID=A0A1H1QZC0_9FLAO|nr:AraC family transcriptional regulator [Christiangramia echinicola]SDS28854.1 Helix-turn-helix domain-containing protein [Christiangramia echinicola]